MSGGVDSIEIHPHEGSVRYALVWEFRHISIGSGEGGWNQEAVILENVHPFEFIDHQKEFSRRYRAREQEQAEARGANPSFVPMQESRIVCFERFDTFPLAISSGLAYLHRERDLDRFDRNKLHDFGSLAREGDGER